MSVRSLSPTARRDLRLFGHTLTTVTSSDGTVSTFTYGGLYRNYSTGVVNQNPANGTLQAETITFVDPGGSSCHQRKTVVLTLANLNVDPNQPFFTQASQLVRSVINDENEVTYQNYPLRISPRTRGRTCTRGRGRWKRSSIMRRRVSELISTMMDGRFWMERSPGMSNLTPDVQCTISCSRSSITEANGEVKTYTYLA